MAPQLPLQQPLSLSDLPLELRALIHTAPAASFHEAYANRMLDKSFHEGYKLICRDLFRGMVDQAMITFPGQVVPLLRQLLGRIDQEWNHRPEGNLFQDPLHLNFNLAQPFPRMCLGITSDAIVPNMLAIEPPAPNAAKFSCGVRSAHGLVVGRTPLRDSTFAKIHLKGSATQPPSPSDMVMIYRPQDGNPCRIRIEINANPIQAGAGSYVPFLGVLKELFVDRQAPVMIKGAALKLLLGQVDNLFHAQPVPRINMPPAVRDPLCLLMVSLKLPSLIPNSRLNLATNNAFAGQCLLDAVLF